MIFTFSSLEIRGWSQPSHHTSRAIDHTLELSISHSACAPPLPKLSVKQTYRGIKDFWETLRILCSGVEEDLPNVLRPRLPLWGSEVGFGAWSSEKGLRGTGKVKSSDNGEQCEEKESNRRIARLFWSFPPHVAGPPSRYIRRIRAHHPVSLFALSLVLRPTPFLYIRFSFDCCSLFHDVFLGRKHTCGANAGPLRGASQRERFPLMETRGRNTWRRRRRRLCYPVNLCNLDQSCLDLSSRQSMTIHLSFFKRDVFAKRDGIDEHRE